MSLPSVAERNQTSAKEITMTAVRECQIFLVFMTAIAMSGCAMSAALNWSLWGPW